MFRKTKCLHIQDVYRKVSHKEKEWEERKRESKYERIDKFAYVQLYYCFNLYSNRKQRNGLTLYWGSVLERNGMSSMTASGELLYKKSRCSSVSGEKCPWTGMLKPNLKKAHRCRPARRKHARKKSCTRCRINLMRGAVCRSSMFGTCPNIWCFLRYSTRNQTEKVHPSASPHSILLLRNSFIAFIFFTPFTSSAGKGERHPMMGNGSFMFYRWKRHLNRPDSGGSGWVLS